MFIDIQNFNLFTLFQCKDMKNPLSKKKHHKISLYCKIIFNSLNPGKSKKAVITIL